MANNEPLLFRVGNSFFCLKNEQTFTAYADNENSRPDSLSRFIVTRIVREIDKQANLQQYRQFQALLQPFAAYQEPLSSRSS